MREMEKNYARTVWVSLGLIMGSFILFGFLLRWLSGEAAARVGEITQKRTELRQQARLVETLAQFKTIAPEIVTYESKLADLIPSRDRLIDFPAWLTLLAKSNGVTVKMGFAQGGGTSLGDGMGEMGFSLEAAGATNRVKSFLDSIERSSPRYVMRLSGLGVTRGNGDDYTVRSTGELLYAEIEIE